MTTSRFDEHGDDLGSLLVGGLLGAGLISGLQRTEDRQYEQQLAQWEQQCSVLYRAYQSERALRITADNRLTQVLAERDDLQVRLQSRSAEYDTLKRDATNWRGQCEELRREIGVREAFDGGVQLPTDPPGDAADYPFSQN